MKPNDLHEAWVVQALFAMRWGVVVLSVCAPQAARRRVKKIER
jgi:hypothetical protein